MVYIIRADIQYRDPIEINLYKETKEVNGSLITLSILTAFACFLAKHSKVTYGSKCIY